MFVLKCVSAHGYVPVLRVEPSRLCITSCKRRPPLRTLFDSLSTRNVTPKRLRVSPATAFSGPSAHGAFAGEQQRMELDDTLLHCPARGIDRSPFHGSYSRAMTSSHVGRLSPAISERRDSTRRRCSSGSEQMTSTSKSATAVRFATAAQPLAPWFQPLIVEGESLRPVAVPRGIRRWLIEADAALLAAADRETGGAIALS